MTKKIWKHVGFWFLVSVMGIAGFFVGYGVVFAYAIPGWDRPYDPPNYYDPDRISWADTSSPTFFYRDLGWQGGNVYDHSRDMQSDYEKENTLNWLKILLERVAVMIQNYKPLDNTILYEAIARMQGMQKNTQELNRSNAAAKLLQSTVLRDLERYDESVNSYDPKQKAAIIGDTYASFANAAADSQRDADIVNQTVDNLLNAANQAEGDRQLQQIRGQMMGLEESEKARQNTLLAQLAQLRAIEQKIKTDEDLAYYRQVQEAQLHMRDPYYPAKREREQYQQPKGCGWVEFP